MAYTTIDDPTIYFNTKLYTGNGTAIGSGGQSITGVGFQPDWTWIKVRSISDSHQLYDAVRGGTKGLRSDTTGAEGTNTEFLSTFDSDGFTVGNNSKVNQNSETYVAWNWKAGGSASSNTDGTITSSVSANTTAGFSIVSWLADGGNTSTAGHGLGTTPKIIIYKSRGSGAWYVWINQLIDSSHDYLLLNGTNTKADINTSTYGTPSSTTISNFGFTNGENMIAYCFAEKKGYSKFGSYTGNGNADGTFVYTGFKPAWLMIKSSSYASTSWVMHDNKRDTFNIAKNNLDADNSDAEASVDRLDILSNGFKSRSTLNFNNRSGETYIYMAFAESPFVNSNGIPNNAR